MRRRLARAMRDDLPQDDGMVLYRKALRPPGEVTALAADRIRTREQFTEEQLSEMAAAQQRAALERMVEAQNARSTP